MALLERFEGVFPKAEDSLPHRRPGIRWQRMVCLSADAQDYFLPHPSAPQ